MAKKVVFGGTNSQDLGRRIARKIKAPYSSLVVKHFPDGETNLRLPKDVKGKEVILVESMHPDPNEIMIEIIFASRTAKELGAKKVTIVAPYLAYMRQDKRFHSRECKSNTIMSALMTCGDRIMTVDPHLHRISSLSEIFDIPAKRLSANDAIAEYIKKNIKNEVIVGPDSESYQWARAIADKINVHATVLKKKRYTSRHVRIKVKSDIDFRGKNVVIVDDIISTGHTMIEPIKQIKKMGAKKIYCIGVHGLFVEGALKRLKKIGAKVITTNTIPNPASRIDLSGTIAKALK
ncbi:ribose-phosphate diphosphokinase [Candidatus Woesearchaeota archaeon]|nr:ribose-phosphate diphosphokinase [Candidatus Woesearchaeota archaeon]